MFLGSMAYLDGINQDFRVNHFPEQKVQTFTKSVNCAGRSLKNRL